MATSGMTGLNHSSGFARDLLAYFSSDCNTLRMAKRQLIGGFLLILGGIADVTRVIAGSTISVPIAPPLLAALTMGPALVVAAGCLVLASVFRGRARAGYALVAAGGAILAIVNITQIVATPVAGPIPSQIAYGLSLLLTVAGGALALLGRAENVTNQWALAIPAGAVLLVAVSVLAVPLPGVEVMPPLGFAVAGAFLVMGAVRATRGSRRVEV